MGVVPPIDDVLTRVAMFSGQELAVSRIEGGLSHQVFVVRTGGSRYVVRVLDPAVSWAGLGVPPSVEISNTVRAAESGVGATVHEVLPDVPALVLEFVDGRTLASEDLADPAMLRRVATACRRLHAGPRFAGDFSIMDKLTELLDVCDRHELSIPDGYRERLGTVDTVWQALAVAPVPTRPCHNDLLAANFIDAGADIRIVDYQLSGNNDPTFELGDIAAEAQLHPDHVELLGTAYFGAETSPALLARIRLNLLLSNVTWTLWFSVHHGLLRRAEATFDYWTEAGDKWQRAQRDLDDPDLGRLLAVVAHRSGPPTGGA